MNVTRLLMLAFLSLAIVSCQKEPSAELPENNNPDPTPDGSRLVRMVYQYSPTDSAYTEFFYDAAGRWTGMRTSGDDDAVLTESSEVRVQRNSQGIITSYTVKEDDGAGTQETVEYRVHYDAAAKRYTSKVVEFESGSETIIDSTVFVINNGRMATQRYLFGEKESGLAMEVGKLEFMYDAAGNPVQAITYSKDPVSGSTEKETEINMQFDSKTAALNLGVEALVLDQIFFASPNNIVSLSFTSMLDPDEPEEQLINIDYQYHPSNKPKSGLIKFDGIAIPLAFRYQ